VELHAEAGGDVVGEHPLGQFAGIEQAVRSAAVAAGLLAESRRKQNGVHPLSQLIARSKIARELIVCAVAQHKLDLVMGMERIEVLHVEGIGLAGVGAFDIHNLDHASRHMPQRALAARFQQDGVAFIEQTQHERNKFALLEHRFAAGDFCHASAGAQLLDFFKHFLRRHAVAAGKGVFAVAPRATEVAPREAHEYAGQPAMRGLTLDGFVNLGDLHAVRILAPRQGEDEGLQIERKRHPAAGDGESQHSESPAIPASTTASRISVDKLSNPGYSASRGHYKPRRKPNLLPSGHDRALQSNLGYKENRMTQELRGLRGRRLPVLFIILTSMLFLAMPVFAQYTLVQVSVDNFKNTDSVHKTEVEPDSFAWGSAIVDAYHVARRPGSIGWGSADVGFSTSTDGGTTWHYGYLPGLTKNYKGGTFGATADPSVAYDAKHGVWMISTLPLVGLSGSSGKIGDVGVNLSTDGLHWGNVILIDKTALDDKNWTVCDNTSTSPYYGNCYTEWDQAYGSGEVLMSVSSDGGNTWGAGKASADRAVGLGGEPLVQPNGTVIVPFEGGGIDAFTSTNGGSSWNRSVVVSSIDSHFDSGDVRNPNLPSAAIDGGGTAYVVWSDCRFRSGCKENDIVMSTSTNGTTWTSPLRIPIDPTTSTVDHFLPGIGADPGTSGASAHLTIVYYYYPTSNCSTSTCQLDVGFVTSSDGGNTWTSGVQLAGPMTLTWLPLSDNGYMVADYISVSYSNGNPFGIFAVAKAPSGTTLNEAMYTTKQPLLAPADAPRFSSKVDQPVPGAKSDHKMTFYLDDEGKIPIPPEKLRTPQQ